MTSTRPMSPAPPPYGIAVQQPVPRPVLLGYVRADALTTERELAQSASDLAAFADREGYALGTVFVERTDRVPAAFEALMSEAARVGASAVLMPGPQPRLLPCAWSRQPAPANEVSMP
jgi:hypothetical protein